MYFCAAGLVMPVTISAGLPSMLESSFTVRIMLSCGVLRPELLSRHRIWSVTLLALLGSSVRCVLSTASCVGVSPGLLSMHHRQYTDCTGYILRTEAIVTKLILEYVH